jgi:hypothetical protein
MDNETVYISDFIVNKYTSIQYRFIITDRGNNGWVNCRMYQILRFNEGEYTVDNYDPERHTEDSHHYMAHLYKGRLLKSGWLKVYNGCTGEHYLAVNFKRNENGLFGPDYSHLKKAEIRPPIYNSMNFYC